MIAWASGLATFIVLCGFPACLARQRFRSLTCVEAVALSIGTNDVSLNAFIDNHVEQGWITAVDKIGDFTGYSVQEIHPVASPPISD